MAERRKGNILRLPGAMLMLVALAGIFSVGAPHGAAADSPAADSPAADSPAAGAPLAADASTASEAPLATETSLAEEVPLAAASPAEPEAVWAGPVPESAPVDDTYFDDVVFLGDSRTDGLRLSTKFGHGTFLCATGATVESVFTKAVETPGGKMPLLDALAAMDCGKIYLMLGINELGWKGTDLFRTQSALLLERLRADHPEAELVIQSILPVSAQKDAEGRYVNNGRINEYNQVWMELAEELDIAYLNVAESVADENGLLPPDLCRDGVHLTPEGCRLWLDYLRTHPVGGTGSTPADSTDAPEEALMD